MIFKNYQSQGGAQGGFLARVSLSAMTIFGYLFLTSAPALSGSINETFLSDHEGWRVFRNYHVASDKESCLVINFAYPSVMIAMSESNRFVHFILKTEGIDRNQDVHLVFKDGKTYTAQHEVVQFPDYSARFDFINRLYAGRGDSLVSSPT